MCFRGHATNEKQKWFTKEFENIILLNQTFFLQDYKLEYMSILRGRCCNGKIHLFLVMPMDFCQLNPNGIMPATVWFTEESVLTAIRKLVTANYQMISLKYDQ